MQEQKWSQTIVPIVSHMSHEDRDLRKTMTAAFNTVESPQVVIREKKTFRLVHCIQARDV